MRPKRTISMRSRPVSDALSVSENSLTAAWPLRSSGAAHKPRVRRSVTPSRPTSRPTSVIASGVGACVSPLIALISSFCPLPATPATPKISPALTLSATSRNAMPNSLGFGRLKPCAESLGGAKAAPQGLSDFLQVGADHHLGHRARGLALRVTMRDHLATAQYGRRVAERHDLVQFVGDVEDRAAARRQFSQGLEPLLDLLRCHDRGRLVHDQEPRIEQESAHDLDALALADAQRRDDSAGIELELVGFEHPIEFGQKFARREARVEAERDVFEHRHRLEQREVLEHHADAKAASCTRIGDPGGRPVEDDLALVGREDAVDHLDQGRFSRAVLAEQGVNLARPHAQVDVVIRADTRKGLADADELQTQGSFDFHLDFTSLPIPVRLRSTACDAKTAPRPPHSGEEGLGDARFPPACLNRTPQFWATVAGTAAVSNELAAMICGVRRD